MDIKIDVIYLFDYFLIIFIKYFLEWTFVA